MMTFPVLEGDPATTLKNINSLVLTESAAGWWIFAVAGAAAFLIALATVSYHGLRAARINPGRSLQAE
jgi:hypothetical protein